ncbi:MAG: S9 family peptidase [Planctomycetaceae bacterium]|nr:S9 family peptidase [Planctomycetaceae bacterium]
MKATIAALGVVFSAAFAHAADPVPGKPLDTTFLKQYAETRGFMLGRPQKPKIAPDGKTVLFLRADPKTPKLKLFEFTVANGQTKELLSPETLLQGAEENLSPEEKARRERQRVSVGGFTDYHFDRDGKRVLVALAGKLYVFDRVASKATELKTGTGVIVDPKWSPDGTKVAYVRGFDVYAYDHATEKESAVTTGGTLIKTHGLAEFVAQEEMGRFTGYWWSPDGKHIAYEEADHTGVETWYVADPLKPDQKPAEQFYPRPGKKNVSVRLGIVSVDGGETKWVEWERAKYEYLAEVSWQKYGHLTILLQDRKQQEMRYFIVDPRTGKLAAIGPMWDEAFLNLHPGSARWLKSAVRENSRGFLWVQQNAKFQVLTPVVDFAFLFEDVEAKPEFGKGEDVTAGLSISFSGLGGFRDMVACDAETGSIVFSASPHHGDTDEGDPTQTILIRSLPPARSVDEDRKDRPGFGRLRACKDAGVYSGEFSSNLTLSTITKTTLHEMPHSTVYREDGSVVGSLPSRAAEPPFTPNVKVEKVGDFWTAIVRPRNFDPKKKYPVIVDVYGGPRHLHVVQAMRNWLVPQWLADQGFIVVAIENRGTPGRTREWERAIYQRFGTVPIEDQVKELALLCDKFPELDRDRVGIVGWSFGGYMAANGVLRKPDVFKAAVAGAPVTDWEDYDTHYTERYMGLLPESKAAYDAASLLPLAKDLKRPLMLVHGTADDNVYYRHTLKLSDALFRAGRDFEALALPGVTHMYSADPTVMERLWSKTASFFKTHLGEAK